jgi:Domain of unknown function (DUF1992)
VSESGAQEKKEQRLKLLEDHIGQHLRESQANGELRAAPSFGKPLAFADGYDETPAELRMGMKILKDAGVLPPEVELMQQAAALEARLHQTADADERRAMQQQLADLRQAIALRLERLRVSGGA